MLLCIVALRTGPIKHLVGSVLNQGNAVRKRKDFMKRQSKSQTYRKVRYKTTLIYIVVQYFNNTQNVIKESDQNPPLHWLEGVV